MLIDVATINWQFRLVHKGGHSIEAKEIIEPHIAHVQFCCTRTLLYAAEYLPYMITPYCVVISTLKGPFTHYQCILGVICHGLCHFFCVFVASFIGFVAFFPLTLYSHN